MSERPNIVYLNSHDTGRYISPYGYPIHSPNFQRLAQQGVLYRNCHCAGPTCSPSRASLMTGEYPHKNGMIGLAHRGHRLVDYSTTLPAMLRGQGYETATWGMATNHCLREEQGRHQECAEAVGFERMIGWQLEDALGYLREAHQRPFFLTMSWGLNHRGGPQGPRGFSTPPDHGRYDPRYIMPPEPLPDTPENREDWAWFCSDASAWDHQVGLVLEQLEAAGLADNTLVIATTDHGVPFPDMKCQLTKHGTGVMLLMRGPGGFSGGQVIDHMVSHLDIWPTLAGLVGAELPDRLDGHDLRPILGAESRPIHAELMAEVTYHAAYEPKRSLRTDRWLYIRRFGNRRQPVMANCDHGLSKDVWVREGWTRRLESDEELYDLAFDPQERCNLAADPRYQPIRDEYRARLERWMQRSDDPLRHGDVPLPEGCITTVVDEPSANGPRLIRG